MLEAEADILAYKSFLNDYWRCIHSTNLLERLNKKINRRTKVVGIFPDQSVVIHLVGPLPIEIDDDWRTIQRRYFATESMQLLIDSKNLHKKGTSSFLVELTTTV